MLTARQTFAEVKPDGEFFECMVVLFQTVHPEIVTRCFLRPATLLEISHSPDEVLCQHKSMVKVLEQDLKIELLQLLTVDKQLENFPKLL